ncbi:MAG: hypothetical protein CMJ89_02495 [Planctomycetes bacterium]|jgi:4-amino-4-deoxy-L-arabinose transferase-like glycosyltransferase|nr:hypothetical protein [Planctomycetota bacterium]
MLGRVETSATPSSSEIRRNRRVAAFLVLACGLCLFVWVHPWYDPTNDGSMYIATARSLVAGEGYTYLGESFRIRPPGFSLLLAPLIALAGTNFLAINVFVSLFGVLAIVALFFFCAPRLGTWLALLVALVVWINPGFQRLCNQVMSDVPGIASVLLALLAERRLQRRPLFAEGGWKRQLLFGAAVALAGHVRTSVFLLLPAILAARCLGRFTRNGEGEPWRPWVLGNVLFVLGAIALIAPWSVRNAWQAPEGPADQTRLYDYSSGMWHRDMGDPNSERLSLAEIGARFPERAVQIGASLGSRLVRNERSAGANAWAVFFIVCTAMILVRRREAAELYVLANLVVVAFYFGFASRLMLPCWIFALPATVEVLRGTVRIFLRPGLTDAVVALALVVFAVRDAHPRRGWENIENLHRAYVSVAEEIEQRAPEGKLGAYRAWHLAAHLDRDVYGFEQVQRRAGEPNACEEIIDKYGVETVVLLPLGLPSLLLPEYTRLETYLENRYGAVPGPLKLVRVRP